MITDQHSSLLKSEIRNELSVQRNSMDSTEVQARSQMALQNILDSKIFTASQTIAFYLPTNNELDLNPILHQDKTFLLPVVHSTQTMHFSKYKLGDPLKMNRFKIMEPEHDRVFPSEEIDLCLLPMLGFHRNGARLGMGGGFYDRYFAINHMLSNPTVLAGVAYYFQEDTRITQDYWDVPLNYIFTDKEQIKI